MKISKMSALSAGALSLSALMAGGQALDVAVIDFKRFKITGPRESEYQEGSWGLSVVDGSVTVLVCDANNGIEFTGPTITCPNGTTGLITQGDFDGDGINDIGRYFSVTRPIRAQVIAPFRTDIVELVSAPLSTLPRGREPLDFTNNSFLVFYDLVNDPIGGIGYEITNFFSTREYPLGALERHRDEVAPGTYRFVFPSVGYSDDNRLINFQTVAVRGMIEAAPGPGGRDVLSGGVNFGNDFEIIDANWADGAIEIDPRGNLEFRWRGVNGNTFLPSDEMYFSIRSRETGALRFPPVPPGNPEGPQVIGGRGLGIPTGYNLGPNFFNPDEGLVVILEMQRALGNGFTTDRSSRIFEWDVNLIDTYEGTTRDLFPPLTPLDLRLAEGDFDDDGFTNLEEFALQTDILDPASVPNITPTIDDFTQQCIVEIAKRPGIGSTLTYNLEYSADLETWTPIGENDPNWFTIFDDPTRFAVVSRQPVLAQPCFVRIAITQNN